MSNELELKVFLAAGQLEKLEMQRDQAEFELLETLSEAIDKGLPAEKAARAANMTLIELLAKLDLRTAAVLPIASRPPAVPRHSHTVES